MVMVKVSPDVFSCSSGDKLELEVDLPGVKKEDIEFKMLEDGFFINAKKGDELEYGGTYAFCCPVIPEKALAKYFNGKLVVTVPYKEALKAVDIKID
ncbi:MAG: Hsp20/alpha crystallin family protein [Methanosarcinaceae archaeon]|nr:Hsp20/alpha crystallin family protein [Methanosarcinaceae archaeon]MDD4331027.1 Hsp20/alpha crystallin family protein [Methanosarcinaceae archaeon]MDD4748944.1 Hsp20/alpha crystallin family protein [Methanosarcinaceae archaeon]